MTKTAKPLPEKKTEGKKTKARRLSRAKLFFILGASFLLLGVASFTAYTFAYSNKVLPHSYVNGVSVGGLSQAALQERLQQLGTAFLDRPLTVTYADKSWEIKGKDLQLQVDTSTAANQAYQRGRLGSFTQRLGDHLQALFSSQTYSLSLAPLDSGGRKYLQSKVSQGVEQPYVETDLALLPGKVEVIPGKSGMQLDYSYFEENIEHRLRDGGNQIPLQLHPVQPQVSKEMAESARHQAELDLATPLHLNIGGKAVSLEPKDIATWLDTVVEMDAQERVTAFKLTLKEEVVKKVITDLANQNNQAATNARLKMENGAVAVESDGRNGLQLNQEKTLALLRQTLLSSYANPVEAVVDTVQPVVRRETLNELGIKELIGTATTDYTGSPNNRKFNIDLGQKSLNGSVVRNNEVFSTTAALGPVDESTGYLPELVIVNNRTVPEAGGGLCQVSTTLFRAVLNAGLPIVERTNHAYRVGYYERGVGPGLDATVYIPSPDFKWKNDTGNAILVQSYVKDNKISFDLYGTKDGRVSTISTPQILEETQPGPAIYVDSDSLYKGETKQIETAHAGAKTKVSYKVVRNGQEIYAQTFYSNYRPWQAQYLVGTKERPADSPAPTATPTPSP